MGVEPFGNGPSRIHKDLVQVEVVVFKITVDPRLPGAVDENSCHGHVTLVFRPDPVHRPEFADAGTAGCGCDDHDIDLGREDIS